MKIWFMFDLWQTSQHNNRALQNVYTWKHIITGKDRKIVRK